MNEHPKQRTAPLVAEEFPAAFAAPEKCVACAARCTNDPPDCYASGGQNAAGASEGQAYVPRKIHDQVCDKYDRLEAELTALRERVKQEMQAYAVCASARDSLVEELTALQKQNAEFGSEIGKLYSERNTRSAELTALRERVAGVEKDAERIDWLEQEDEMGCFYNIDHITANINEGFNGFKTLREAIDTAMKEPKQ